MIKQIKVYENIDYINIIRYYTYMADGSLIIKESSKYKRDLKKLERKHMNKEINNIKEICEFVSIFDNMYELLSNNQRFLYGIEKNQGNLKEIYTAKINSKLRLYMHPVGDYPCNLIEIEIIELEKIDDKHYGEG